LQRLVPVDGGCADPLDGRRVRRGLPLQLQELVAQGLHPVRQPAIPGPQGLCEDVKSVALLPELAELGAHLVEGTVPVAGAELQLLPSADEIHECRTTKTNTKTTRSKKKATS
jgi:hypothetical protein